MNIKAINRLMNDYRRECEEILTSFKNKRDEAKNEIDNISRVDYYKDVIETYSNSLATLDAIYQEYVTLEESTFGLTFSISEYIKTLKPRFIIKGKVMETVNLLVEEIKKAVEGINASLSVEQDVPYLMSFAQAYLDFNHIVKNARFLLQESGQLEKKKEDDLKEPQERLKKYQQAIKNGVVKSDLPCFDRLMKVKRDLQEEISELENLHLSASHDSKRSDYKVLLGFKTKTNIDPFILKFLKEDLEIDNVEALFEAEPVFFSPKDGKGALVISAPGDYLQEITLLPLLKKIYYSFIASYEPRKMKVFGMEHVLINEILELFSASTIKKMGLESFIIGGHFAENADSFAQHVKYLQDIYQARQSEIITADYTTFYEYNEHVSKDKQIHPILVLINNYPNGIAERADVLKIIANWMKKGAQYGIFTIVFQQSDYHKEFTPFIKNESTDFIEYKSDDSITFNGEEINMNIYAQDWDEKAFIEKMAQENSLSTSSDLLSFIKKDEVKAISNKPFYKALSIPLGMNDDQVLKMNIPLCDTACNMFLIGNSGTGKSYFIHSLIFNTAMLYPPDEVQFNIIDFKAKKSNVSQDFNAYKEGEPLYIPHVRYLSFGNSKANAMELIRKIEVEKSYRASVLRGMNFESYNAQANVKKLPVAFYIIDESNVFLGYGDTSSVSLDLEAKIQSIFKTIRSYGICILFAGQDVPSAIEASAGNIKTLISFSIKGCNTLRAVKKLVNDDNQILNSIIENTACNINKEGQLIPSGRFAFTNNGATTKPLYGSIAYGGKIGSESDEYAVLASTIREKYKDYPQAKEHQAVAGSTALVPLSHIDGITSGSFEFDENKNLALQEENTKYYLPIGVSSSSMLLFDMEYSCDKSALNYSLACVDHKAYRIERSMILEILDRKRRLDTFADSKIYYNALVGNKNRFLESFEDSSITDKIEEEVIFKSDKKEMADTIMDLYDEYLQRKNEFESGTTSFKPIYLISHDIDWLIDKDDTWLKFDQEKVETLATDQEKDELQSLIGDGFDDLLGSLATSMNLTSSNKEEKEVKIYDKNELKHAFATLYGLGNRYQIFLLNVSSNPSALQEVKSLFRGDATIPSEAFSSYWIYDSYELSQGENKPGHENTAYVLPSSSTVCLFDTSKDKNSEFYTRLW